LNFRGLQKYVFDEHLLFIVKKMGWKEVFQIQQGKSFIFLRIKKSRLKNEKAVKGAVTPFFGLIKKI